jgi:F420-dependent oxidoreductase-like protein
MARELKLGLNTGYWAGGPPPGIVDVIADAERLGFDSVWTAEAYGSDGLTPLAWWGSATERLKLGTAITQMSARQPAATAMAAMTMDHLSGGRFVLGLGVSGPQVVEGWYGTPFAKPLARTREYIGILRDIWAREAPVTNDGPHYALPYRGDDATGLGKPLKASIHPLREDIPIFLGAEGPKNVALAAEICDGWLPTLFSPEHVAEFRPLLEEGFARAGDGKGFDGFEIAPMVNVMVSSDLEGARDLMRPYLALYVGGMGSREQNFYNALVRRYGFEEAAETVQSLYLDGRKEEAAAALPGALIDTVTLCGPPERVRERLAVFRDAGVGTLMVAPMAWTFDERLEQLRLVAELAG